MSRVVQAFSKVAEEYDRWYEGNPLFLSEVEAVKSIGPVLYPSLEVGVGTGRFAAALGIDFGLDPTLSMLSLAYQKGVKVVCGTAEALPFKSQVFRGVYFLFTFCFLEDQKKALEEARRVLSPQGLLILGLINRDSPWGAFYLRKREEGHPLYSLAWFLTPEEARDLAEERGFVFEEAVSTLFRSPEEPPQEEPPRKGLWPEAGFIVLSFRRS